MIDSILKVIKQNSRVGLLAVSIFLLAGTVSAEPQFGGDVSGVIRCTCDENAGGVHFIVGDPHGDENGNMTAYVAPPGVEMDCALIIDGEETLGMHTDEDTECKIQVGNACILAATGKKVEYFGSSPATCDTGLDGDASGDGKTEMMTPDGRTADGGDEDDGGPSGGPSNATQSDAHLVSSTGQDYGGSNNTHMQTPDNQDYEGAGTEHMAVDSRLYDGSNETVMTVGGSDNGYSEAGGGRPGGGYGSIGGSVGSVGLGAPGVGSSGRCPDNCSATVAGMTAQCSTIANGGRPHFRFNASGGTICAGTCTVEINCGGQLESYTINNGANRDDRGGFLWKPASESDGNLVILGPSSMTKKNTQNPVVLGDKDYRSDVLRKTKATEKLDIAASYSTQEATNKEIMLKLLIVIGGIGGAGYFVFRSIRKLFN
jgi:hypothetical protein